MTDDDKDRALAPLVRRVASNDATVEILDRIAAVLERIATAEEGMLEEYRKRDTPNIIHGPVLIDSLVAALGRVLKDPGCPSCRGEEARDAEA
jgi:hypothetical protein